MILKVQKTLKSHSKYNVIKLIEASLKAICRQSIVMWGVLLGFCDAEFLI